MIRTASFFLLTLLMAQCQPQSNGKNQGTPAEPVVEDYTEFYDNGQLRIEGKLVNGERHGMWHSFQNGLRWSETSFRDGKKSGLTTTYYENGMMRYTGTYYNDERTGEWIFYDEEGLILKRIDFTPREGADTIDVSQFGLPE